MFVKHKTNQNVFVTAEDQSECVFFKQKTNQNVCLSCRRPIGMCVCHAEDQSEVCLSSRRPIGMCVCHTEDQSECVVIKQAINQDCTTVANDHHNETRQCEGLEAGVWFLDATVGRCGHCFTTLPSAS